jgi:hypothetical protein
MTAASTHRHVRASLALGVALACAVAAPAGAQGLDVVADGLSNPHGIAFGPDGKLYVAEAGRGGSGPCIPGPEAAESCYGATGAITRVNVKSGKSRQILRGLPSLAAQSGDTPGSDGLGPNDVSFRGRTAYFTIGLGSDPAARDQLGRAGRRFAGLYRIGRSGAVRRVVDLGAYEAKNDPDKGQPTAEVDTNPFSVDASGPGRILVTDAGANALLRVSPSGRVNTVAVFPFGKTVAPPFLGLPPGTQVDYQPVPTGVVRAAGGAAYVGQLTGFPFPADAANVFHVTSGGELAVHANGFTNVVDVARSRDGDLYALQISTTGLAGEPSPGKLLHVAADGTKTELAAGRLEHPTGIAVAKNGDIYVANRGGSPNNAQIVRISPTG